MTNATTTTVGIAALLGMMGLIWFVVAKSPTDSPDIVTRNGIHWHPQLDIFIKGALQEIPANIGIGGAAHKSTHTHDTSGKIHLETGGLVRTKDVRLGVFFKNWGKSLTHECIFDQCNGPEGHLKMDVNGKANTEFEDYLMQDGDKIEIRYE